MQPSFLLLHHLLRHEASQKHFPRRLLQKIGPSHVPNSIQFIKIPSLDWWLPRICKVFRMMYPSRRSFQYHVFFTSLLHRHWAIRNAWRTMFVFKMFPLLFSIITEGTSAHTFLQQSVAAGTLKVFLCVAWPSQNSQNQNFCCKRMAPKC